MNEQILLEWATSIIKRNQSERFFGNVIFRFENGRITLITTEKNEKPPCVDKI